MATKPEDERAVGIDPKKFERIGLGGEVELRLCFGIMLFFGRDMAIHGAQVLEVWNELLRWRGREVFTWARLGGGNKSRKMDASAYRTVESWLNGSRPFGRTCWLQIHGGNFEEIGTHGFSLDGSDPTDRRLSGIGIRLPFDLPLTAGGDELVRRVASIAAPLDFLSGTAGFMLHATPFGRQRLWPEMKKLVTRYEGVEPDIVEDGEWTADRGLQGINWLTLLGPGFIDKLGGPAALEKAASGRKLVTAVDVGRGMLLRAGPEPRLGDRNRGPAELAPYREVYEMVKPVIFAHPDYAFDKQHFSGDDTVDWIHRFGRP